MKKYRQYETPEGWCYKMNYGEMMQLRSAYNGGVRTPETKEACSVYMDWRRKKKELKCNQPQN